MQMKRELFPSPGIHPMMFLIQFGTTNLSFVLIVKMDLAYVNQVMNGSVYNCLINPFIEVFRTIEMGVGLRCKVPVEFSMLSDNVAGFLEFISKSTLYNACNI